MADLTLTLGSITFSGVEIPQSIPGGGHQRMAVHELVGGARVIDAMGRADRPAEWSGWLIGPNAQARAQAIDALRVSGAVQTLAWGVFQYQVVVRAFEWEFERTYQIRYRIMCEVVADQTLPVAAPAAVSVDQAIQADYASAQVMAAAIANASLTAAMQALGLAMEAIILFALAPKSAIGVVLAAVADAQLVTQGLLTSTDTSIGALTGFAGVTPGLPAASALSLSGASVSMFTEANLYTLAGTLGRMSANMQAVNDSPNTVTVAGGNLFQIAESQYADATAWAAIAQANGLTDPFIQGVDTLTIPAQPGSSGGILSS